jgi:hypothetical protein
LDTHVTMHAEEHFVVPRSDIDAYQRDGALLLRQPFKRAWIDGLLAAFDEALALADSGDTFYKVIRRPGVVSIQNMILRHPFYKKWAVESPVASIVGQVTQSETVRFYFDNFFGKEGATGPSQGTPFHHDVAAFGFKGRQLPSFWLALTDVDIDNAPLVIYAGSQHGLDGKGLNEMFRSSIQKPGLPLLPGYREHAEVLPYVAEGKFERRVLLAEKGDVIMLNPYTIHGSLDRKREDGRRIGFSSRWMGSDVRWRPTIYNEVEESCHIVRVPDGAPPPDEMFPVVWSRQEGNLALRTGRFTSHITLEPKSGERDKAAH